MKVLTQNPKLRDTFRRDLKRNEMRTVCCVLHVLSVNIKYWQEPYSNPVAPPV